MLQINSHALSLAMARKGYNNVTLAEAAEVCKKTVNNAKQGHLMREPTVGLLAKALDVTVEDLAK